MKQFPFIFMISLLFFVSIFKGVAQKVNQITVPLKGNSWVDSNYNRKIYVYLNSTGQLRINHSKTENIVEKGYHTISLSKSEFDKLADTNNLMISGSAIDDKTAYVKNNDGNFYYWGRRGPSVHLNYDISTIHDSITWFYTELEVPSGYDPIGSYFMANGFGEGYFGMQVNSINERRILFSVWSPFSTDDPDKIPLDERIQLLDKGPKVIAKPFGSEGSGGQSFLRYNWKTGNTYGFLVHVAPTHKNSTEYTAYFYAPELSQWQLIASFERPKTHTYFKRPHSFLENFEPNTGNIVRKAYYKNQWAYTENGKWIPIHQVRFTGDATAKKGYRLDYSGGIENGKFFLMNCGFFNEMTSLNSMFYLPNHSNAPVIDFVK